MNRLLRLSQRAYQVLLYLYPAEHRREYGSWMAQAFRDLNRAAWLRGGRRGSVMLWLRTLADVVLSAGIEHFSLMKRRLVMSRRSLFVWLLTGLFALITGYVNVHNNEVQAPMACILLFSFILGLLRRKMAWLRAIVIGLSIPASYFLAFAINVKPVDPPRLPITTAVLVIPALVACYAGVVVNMGIAPLQRRTS